MSAVLRGDYLRALGVEPLRLKHARVPAASEVPAGQDAVPTAPATAVAETTTRIRRLALLPDTAELADPALNAMYSALSAAVSKAGLQSVRPCDVALDPSAVMMVFGTAPLPDDVPAVRVVRADPLWVLYADRERKRRLWERLLALGRGEAG